MDLASVIQSEVSSETEKQITYINAYDIYNIKNFICEPICRAGIEMLTERMDLWTQWRKERIGRIERVALFNMYKTTVCKIALGSCCI